MSENLYIVRDYLPSDHSFIMSTWLKGLRFGCDLFREIESDIYFKAYQNIIESLLKHPLVKVKVACLTEDKDVILGYSVIAKDESKAHFVFVKNSWRGIGICRQLVPNTVKSVTHITKTGLSLIRKHGIKFDPFSIP